MDVCQNMEDFYPHKSGIDVIIDHTHHDKNEAVKDGYWHLGSGQYFGRHNSPNLNLIEGCWRCLKKRMINNTYDEGLSDSTGVILEFCD